MPSTITGTMELQGSLTQKPSGTTLLGLGINAAVKATYKYTAGTAALQIDQLYAQELVLSSPLTLDLTNLDSQTDMARVRELLVLVPDTTAGNELKVSRGASNGWAFLPGSGHAHRVQPNDGYLRLSDNASTGAGSGYVTDSSHKTILLDPGSNTVTCGIVIVGTSVA